VLAHRVLYELRLVVGLNCTASWLLTSVTNGGLAPPPVGVGGVAKANVVFPKPVVPTLKAVSLNPATDVPSAVRGALVRMQVVSDNSTLKSAIVHVDASV